MKILILGANGFIGFALASHLQAAGHDIVGVGRNIMSAQNRLPKAKWISCDIAKFSKPDDWHPLLHGMDVVVNSAGVLQDSPRDQLAALQSVSMQTMYEAARKQSITLIVQISANTTSNGMSTEFFETKKEADKALKKSGLPHVILRPALVVARNAHGGTALVRALAAIPFVTPVSFGDVLCQTTDMDDLCKSVEAAVKGDLGTSGDFAIANDNLLSLREIIERQRTWLGLAKVRQLTVPPRVAGMASKIADCAGWLGWRSPMRSTAMKVLSKGVLVQPEVPCLPTASFDETLARNPAGPQDLWFSRLYLLKPILIFTICLFWIISGLMTFVSWNNALSVMQSAGFSAHVAGIITAVTACLDIILGLGVLFQKHAAKAMIGMILLSLIYLVSATVLTPVLWLDPLGPLVKVFPTLILTLVGLAILDER